MRLTGTLSMTKLRSVWDQSGIGGNSRMHRCDCNNFIAVCYS
jgi:hypothetical protein